MLQICLSYYAPGMSHNYVHFVFPSAICLAAKSILTENSVLYQLLSPHFRFMERLNYQVICNFLSERFFVFIMTTEGLIGSIAPHLCYQEKLDRFFAVMLDSYRKRPFFL